MRDYTHIYICETYREAFAVRLFTDWLLEFITEEIERDLTDVKRSGRDESNRNARIVNGYLNGREQTSADVLGKASNAAGGDFSFKKHASYSAVHSFVCR